MRSEIRVSYAGHRDPGQRAEWDLDAKRRKGRTVDGRSIFGMAHLGAFVEFEDRLKIGAVGPDAVGTVEVLACLLERGVATHEALALRELLPVVTEFRHLAEVILDRGEFADGDLEELGWKVTQFRHALGKVNEFLDAPQVELLRPRTGETSSRRLPSESKRGSSLPAVVTEGNVAVLLDAEQRTISFRSSRGADE